MNKLLSALAALAFVAAQAQTAAPAAPAMPAAPAAEMKVQAKPAAKADAKQADKKIATK